MRNLSSWIKLIFQYLSFIYKKQTVQFAFGMTVHSVTNLMLTVILNGYVTVKFGVLFATIFMYIANIFKVLAMVVIYDLIGKDIFGIELLKDDTEDKKTNSAVKKIKKLLQRLEGFGSLQVQIILIVADNFFGVIYVRPKSRAYNGIPRKMWATFLFSMLLVTVGMTLGAVITQEIYRALCVLSQYFWVIIYLFDEYLTQLFFA